MSVRERTGRTKQDRMVGASTDTRSMKYTVSLKATAGTNQPRLAGRGCVQDVGNRTLTKFVSAS